LLSEPISLVDVLQLEQIILLMNQVTGQKMSYEGWRRCHEESLDQMKSWVVRLSVINPERLVLYDIFT
jgi:hypothetical protein